MRTLRIAFALGAFTSASIVSAQGAPTREHFTVKVDAHPISVWAYRPEHPRATILLVHGKTWSAIPDFDLHVGSESRSLLEGLARAGYAAYAIDLRGYGKTPRDGTGWLTPTRAAADIESILTWIVAQHPTLPVPMLFGWSRGARYSAMVATRGNVPITALVLDGFTFDPAAAIPTVSGRAAPAREPNTANAAASDFISPTVTSQATIDAFVSSALESDPVRADLRGDNEFQSIDAATIHVPTLIIQGERDPGITPAAEHKFFDALDTSDRQLIVIAKGDHAVHLESTHAEFMADLLQFLNQHRTPGARCAVDRRLATPSFSAHSLRPGRFVYREISGGGKDTNTFTLEIRQQADGMWKFTGDGQGQHWAAIADTAFAPQTAELSMTRRAHLFDMRLRYAGDTVSAVETMFDSAAGQIEKHSVFGVAGKTIDQRIDWASLMASSLATGESARYRVFDPGTGSSELLASAHDGPVLRGPDGPEPTRRLDYTICKEGRAESYTVYATTTLPHVMLREDMRGNVISELIRIEP